MFNSDPLMFIETVTTKGLPQGQTVFDSRYDTPKPKKEVNEVLEEKEVEVQPLNNHQLSNETSVKLDSIIDLYHMSKPVICEIVTAVEHYEGIPFYKDNENLLIKKNGEDVSINLQEIQEVLILRI